LARAPKQSPGVQSSLALWYLFLGSELVFVGDAGTTEPGGPRAGTASSGTPGGVRSMALRGSRHGMERRAILRHGPEGKFIPGAPDTVISAGLAVDRYGP